MEKQLDVISNRIILLRNLAVLLSLFSTILIGTLVFIPTILPDLLKIWAIAVAITSVIGISLGLCLSRKDSTTTLFLTVILIFVAGIFIGVSIFALAAHGTA